MREITRRGFIGLAGAAALGAVVGCSSGKDGESAGPATTVPTSRSGLADPKDAPFDTVVVLMMENRSFDHMLGWLPGANGRQAGLSFVDTAGQSHQTWALAPDMQGCAYGDPKHDWQSVATQWNGGACDGFLATAKVGDTFPIGYYTQADLPIMSALAADYTVFDNYFCSMLGPTWPNRLYQWCATTDLPNTGLFPQPDQPRPSQLQTAIFDRVRAAGLTGGYYYFSEPMSGLFASKRYDDISYPIDRFFEDASKGTLPNVTFVDPDYGTIPELQGTSNDDHPWGNIHVGEGFIKQVYEAVARSPQWGRCVLVLNFDEHGGFYDHVSPPAVQDDTVLPGTAPGPDLKRLGFRVPAIAVGPFAAQKLDSGGPYEHCSVLKMIEWRWGLAPMTLRDANANNLASSLDFSLHRDPVDMPAFTAPVLTACVR